MNRAALELKVAAKLELKRRRSLRYTVYGFVDPQKGLTHAVCQDKKGAWQDTQDEIDIFLPAKAERILKSKKRFIVLIGGRGSAKSVTVADICIGDAKDNGAMTYFLREFQASIRNSVYSLVKKEINRFRFDGFNVLDKSIGFKDGQAFEFAGLARNIESVKSTHGFKRFAIEEAQFISETSLDTLTATIRHAPKTGLPKKFITDEHDILQDIQTNPADNVSILFNANPGSSEDPFSKRFINPFKEELDRNGFYEDDLHLIVKMNYTDNPWYEDSGLDIERQWDKAFRSDAFYEHKWLGEHNDTVDDGLILAEWFNTCIDAHLRLGFTPQGAKYAASDPSDTGPDSKGYAMRHGSVVLDVQEKIDGDINDGCDWATGRAIQQGVDHYTWDCDGMGVGLNRQVNTAFKNKAITAVMFTGSESADYPETIYQPADDSQGQRKVKDVFKNKKNQYYWALRDRIFTTYCAVVKNQYADPEKMVSFSSEIECLPKLKAELCRMPIKPNANGYHTLYPKPEMKQKFHIKSPNLGDSVMMLMRDAVQKTEAVHMPRPLKPMGIRR